MVLLLAIIPRAGGNSAFALSQSAALFCGSRYWI